MDHLFDRLIFRLDWSLKRRSISYIFNHVGSKSKADNYNVCLSFRLPLQVGLKLDQHSHPTN